MKYRATVEPMDKGCVKWSLEVVVDSAEYSASGRARSYRGARKEIIRAAKRIRKDHKRGKDTLAYLQG